MKWLIFLEVDPDPIVICRLMNIFRRKELKINSLALASGASVVSFVAIVECAEALMDHMFQFLRTTGGIWEVSCYRHEPSVSAAFVSVNAKDQSNEIAGRFFRAFPGARLVFATGGNYLFEAPSESSNEEVLRAVAGAEVLPFAPVRTTRELPSLLP